MKTKINKMEKKLTAKHLLMAIMMLAMLMPGCRKQMTGQNIQTVLPKPTGPCAVGSRYFYLADRDRPDLISPAPDDYRAVSLQGRSQPGGLHVRRHYREKSEKTIPVHDTY